MEEGEDKRGREGRGKGDGDVCVCTRAITSPSTGTYEPIQPSPPSFTPPRALHLGGLRGRVMVSSGKRGVASLPQSL